MTLPGQAFWLELPNEKTDHLWILLTDPGVDAVAVMLTDVRNVQPPTIVLPKGIPVTTTFNTRKNCTIDCARARRFSLGVLERLWNSGSVIPDGVCEKSLLGTLRKALLESIDTPVEVKEYCSKLGW